jgi:hypothetical protein
MKSIHIWGRCIDMAVGHNQLIIENKAVKESDENHPAQNLFHFSLPAAYACRISSGERPVNSCICAGGIPAAFIFRTRHC